MGIEPVTREQLYAEVWAEPMTKVALRYGVSSSFMARVCAAMSVPRPAVGYWTRLEFGKPVSKPPLPDARPFDMLAWAPGMEFPSKPVLKPAAPVPATKKARAPKKPALTGPRMHPLLRDIRSHFEAGRENRNGYFRPNKKTLSDVVVSKAALHAAVQLANQLYLAFEDLGHEVSWLPVGADFQRHQVNVHEKPPSHEDYETYWYPARLTAVSMGTLAIGLTIFETCEAIEMRYIRGTYYREDQLPKVNPRDMVHSWTTMQNQCTGRFCIQAYSPYGVLDWSRQWVEVKPGELLGKVQAIVTELADLAPELVALYEAAQQRAEVERQRREAEWQRWQAESRAKELLNAQTKSKEALLASIEHWAKVKAMDAFFEDVERRAAELPDDTERAAILANVQQAREVIGSTDALAYFKNWRYPK